MERDNEVPLPPLRAMKVLREAESLEGDGLPAVSSEESLGRIPFLSLARLERLFSGGRAQKTTLQNSVLRNYLEDHNLLSFICLLAQWAKNSTSHPQQILFHTSLAYCLRTEEAHVVCESSNPRLLFRRHSLRALHQNWPSGERFAVEPGLLAILWEKMPPLPVHEDFLGALLYALAKKKHRQEKGVFLPPPSISREIVKEYSHQGIMVLDPGCRTGQFLTQFAKSGHCRLESLYGFDIDPLQAHIAAVNLVMIFKKTDSLPHVFSLSGPHSATWADFCTTLASKFDLVVSAPPWKQLMHSRGYGSFLEMSSTSREAFSFFLFHSLGLAKEGGSISYLLPSAFCTVRTYRETRRYLTENATIKSIRDLGCLPQSRLSRTYRLDIQKKSCPPGHTLTAHVESGEHTIPQSAFLKDKDHIFNIGARRQDRNLLAKIESLPHSFLAGEAEWAVGVVTGDNKTFLSLSQHKGEEPIFRGCDVHPFCLGAPTRFIKLRPQSFQQMAPLALYRAPEKLIYRFVNDRLIFAHDDRQRLTLNSANVCIPRTTKILMTVLCSWLNSSIAQFIHQKKFYSRLILRSNLEQLPIPSLLESPPESLISLVQEAKERKDVSASIDEIFFSCCDITPGEIDLIKKSIH